MSGGHYENTLMHTPWGSYWWHRWIQPDTAVVRVFADKSLVERQGQQRARDGAVRIRQKVVARGLER